MPTKPIPLPTPTAAERSDFTPQPDPPPAAAWRFLKRMKDVPERLAGGVAIAIEMEARRRAEGK